jgi:hypothetical protein
MKRSMQAIAALIIFAAPAVAAAQTAPGQGQSNGQNHWHLNGPDPAPGPDVECGEEEALNRPGQAQYAPGSAFNPNGNAGTHYAGEQTQNSRNTASFSRYDVACLHQNH